MNKFLTKSITLALTATIVTSTLAGCGGKDKGAESSGGKTETTKTQETGTKAQDIKEYTVYSSDSSIEAWLDNDKDVVTKYVEEKFKLRIGDVIMRGDSANKFNTLVAANAVPDVIVASQDRFPEAINLGVTKDLTELVPEFMPNYWNNVIQEKDKPYHYTDGQIHNVFRYDDSRVLDDQLMEDPYFITGGHTLMTREDLLTAAGYKFKPIAQIEAECKAEGRVPTMEDLMTDPPIQTPEDLQTYLTKLKDLNIQVNGLDLIPMTFRWSVFHLGSMFDSGHWKWDSETKTANAYVGSKGAYDYYSYLRNLYQDGLLDKDFLIHKKEQAQQKVFSGRVGVFFTDISNPSDVTKKLAAVDENMVVRPIYFPRTENHGYYDCYTPGFTNIGLNANLDDDTAKRILGMWDWLTTDEAQDVALWGPEEAGLYNVVDGKKVFTDASWMDAVSTKSAQPGGPQDSGLYNYQKAKFWSLIGNVSPLPIKRKFQGTPERSMDPKVDVLSKLTMMASRGMVGEDASVSYGNGDEDVSKASKFFWDEFRKSYLAKLVVTDSKDEFDQVWEETLQAMERATNYSKGQETMKEYFNEKGFN